MEYVPYAKTPNEQRNGIRHRAGFFCRSESLANFGQDVWEGVVVVEVWEVASIAIFSSLLPTRSNEPITN